MCELEPFSKIILAIAMWIATGYIASCIYHCVITFICGISISMHSWNFKLLDGGLKAGLMHCLRLLSCDNTVWYLSDWELV